VRKGTHEIQGERGGKRERYIPRPVGENHWHPDM